MSTSGSHDGRVRLEKFLSDAGVASRRHAVRLVEEGRVLVNDEVVESLPKLIDPRRDRVVVDGMPVRPQPLAYWMVHKPKGVLCTSHDPQKRPTVMKLLPPMRTRLFVVGRLDADSSGLVLLTNDGELAQRITHPRYEIEKQYRVEVRGSVPGETTEKMRKGIWLAEGRAFARRVRIVRRTREQTTLDVVLTQGRNRQIRRMLARLGYKVKALRRTRIGPLELGRLKPGEARPLTKAEVRALRETVAQAEQAVADRSAPVPRRKTRRPRPKPARSSSGTTERPKRPQRRVIS